VARTRHDPAFQPLARMYCDWLTDTARIYDVRYGRNLVKAFRRFQEAGVLELFTTCATHGYLPLLKTHPQAVRAQVLVGQESYRRTFGRSARGVWVPECAFYPGLEQVLGEAGFRYFFVDAHGLLKANVRPHYGLFAPLACPNGVAAFGRDPESSRQVWSSHDGYPGDFDYRDFYRDIGHDLDLDYIAPYILDGKTRIHTGIKYHRVTGTGDDAQAALRFRAGPRQGGGARRAFRGESPPPALDRQRRGDGSPAAGGVALRRGAVRPLVV
jgi:1,4-alpha-glucan branching enzyme